MKKKKIKLEDIQINSFVTNLADDEKNTIKGAASVLGICIMSLDGQGCQIGPIVIAPSAICIPNSVDEGACTILVCNEATVGTIECPDPSVKEACSFYRRGSCGGTIGQ